MQYEAEHAGKWVASKGEKIIAVGTVFTKLQKALKERKDFASLQFMLVPKGPLAG